MTPEQTEELEALKAALKQHIEEAEKATPGPWEVDKSNGWDNAIAMQPCIFQRNAWTSDLDAAFIARARTMSPLACHIALAGIEALEELNNDRFIGVDANNDLLSILTIWKGGEA